MTSGCILNPSQPCCKHSSLHLVLRFDAFYQLLVKSLLSAKNTVRMGRSKGGSWAKMAYRPGVVGAHMWGGRRSGRTVGSPRERVRRHAVGRRVLGGRGSREEEEQVSIRKWHLRWAVKDDVKDLAGRTAVFMTV